MSIKIDIDPKDTSFFNKFVGKTPNKIEGKIEALAAKQETVRVKTDKESKRLSKRYVRRMRLLTEIIQLKPQIDPIISKLKTEIAQHKQQMGELSENDASVKCIHSELLKLKKERKEKLMSDPTPREKGLESVLQVLTLLKTNIQGNSFKEFGENYAKLSRAQAGMNNFLKTLVPEDEELKTIITECNKTIRPIGVSFMDAMNKQQEAQRLEYRKKNAPAVNQIAARINGEIEIHQARNDELRAKNAASPSAASEMFLHERLIALKTMRRDNASELPSSEEKLVEAVLELVITLDTEIQENSFEEYKLNIRKLKREQSVIQDLMVGQSVDPSLNKIIGDCKSKVEVLSERLNEMLEIQGELQAQNRVNSDRIAEIDGELQANKASIEALKQRIGIEEKLCAKLIGLNNEEDAQLAEDRRNGINDLNSTLSLKITRQAILEWEKQLLQQVGEIQSIRLKNFTREVTPQENVRLELIDLFRDFQSQLNGNEVMEFDLNLNLIEIKLSTIEEIITKEDAGLVKILTCFRYELRAIHKKITDKWASEVLRISTSVNMINFAVVSPETITDQQLEEIEEKLGQLIPNIMLLGNKNILNPDLLNRILRNTIDPKAKALESRRQAIDKKIKNADWYESCTELKKALAAVTKLQGIVGRFREMFSTAIVSITEIQQEKDQTAEIAFRLRTSNRREQVYKLQRKLQEEARQADMIIFQEPAIHNDDILDDDDDAMPAVEPVRHNPYAAHEGEMQAERERKQGLAAEVTRLISGGMQRSMWNIQTWKPHLEQKRNPAYKADPNVEKEPLRECNNDFEVIRRKVETLMGEVEKAPSKQLQAIYLKENERLLDIEVEIISLIEDLNGEFRKASDAEKRLLVDYSVQLKSLKKLCESCRIRLLELGEERAPVEAEVEEDAYEGKDENVQVAAPRVRKRDKVRKLFSRANSAARAAFKAVKNDAVEAFDKQVAEWKLSQAQPIAAPEMSAQEQAAGREQRQADIQAMRDRSAARKADKLAQHQVKAAAVNAKLDAGIAAADARRAEADKQAAQAKKAGGFFNSIQGLFN